MTQLIVALPPYLEALEASAGIVPEFVNPKYSDASRTSFKSPTRLECMMQDYAWLLPHGAKVGPNPRPDPNPDPSPDH